MTSPDQRNETLFDLAPDAILIVGERGRILRVNPQAELLFGYTAAELEGQPIEVVIPERFRPRHVGLREVYNEAPRPRRMAASRELWARHKDGTEVAVEVALGPQSGADASVVCIIRDITERLAAKRALQQAHDELERRVAERTEELSVTHAALARVNRELQDFAHVASDDLQEPLRKIQSFGERLRTQSTGALDDVAVDYLARMQNAATRMQRLIQDLFAFSRVTTKASPFEPVSLEAALADVLLDLEVRIDETRATVAVERPLETVDGDPMQLRQLLQNLIGNALKFRELTRAHVVRIAGKRMENAWYELAISDNGIGFEPRYTDRIFGLFQRLHARDVYEGTGVGLAICKKIVERHGGRLTAVGEPGVGATFTVALPMRQLVTQ